MYPELALVAVTASSLVITGALIFALILAEILARSNAALYRQRDERELKAETLLKSWLSPAQLAQYNQSDHFEVNGSQSGSLYRIRRDRQMNIDELNEHGTRIAV
jgi:hypothetical protein